MVSAARYVDDVDADPVVLFDGLTKNWRYPGWRCTWIVGPQQVIEAVRSSGSFLDGGGSKPLQRAAVPLLAPDGGAPRKRRAIREAFLPQAADHAGGIARGGRALRPRARRHVLLLGRRLRPAGGDQRRDVVLPRRAGAEGDLRSGRVLRRESGQAPERTAVPVPPLRAVLVWARSEAAGRRGE